MNERNIIITNVGDCGVVLSDTQGRMYALPKTGQIRVSLVILQDILDWPGSRKIFNLELVKIKGEVTEEELFNMGLSEAESKKFFIKEKRPAKKAVEETIEKEETKTEEKSKTVKKTTKKTK